MGKMEHILNVKLSLHINKSDAPFGSRFKIGFHQWIRFLFDIQFESSIPIPVPVPKEVLIENLDLLLNCKSMVRFYECEPKY